MKPSTRIPALVIASCLLVPGWAATANEPAQAAGPEPVPTAAREDMPASPEDTAAVNASDTPAAAEPPLEIPDAGAEGANAIPCSLAAIEVEPGDMLEDLPERDRWIWKQAEINLEVGDYNQAEKQLFRFLAYTESKAAKRLAMLAFIRKYYQNGLRMKLVFLLENYIDRFDNDPMLPAIYLYLGKVYSSIGDMDSARKHFYNVLHLALHFAWTQSHNYQKLSLEAKWGIAETFFASGEYGEAITYYERMTRFDLDPEQYARALAKIAECHFLLEDHSAVVKTLANLRLRNDDEFLPPHVHYYLAKSLWSLARRKESIDQVIRLLERVSPKKDSSPADWLYWKERTGNHMAGAFFQEADYLNALKIYQAMAPLSDTGDWQIPIVYHIALCFENLHMAEKALQAYQYITTFPEDRIDPASGDIDTVNVIREAAGWKIRHLRNLDALNQKILSLELDSITEPLESVESSS